MDPFPCTFLPGATANFLCKSWYYDNHSVICSASQLYNHVKQKHTISNYKVWGQSHSNVESTTGSLHATKSSLPVPVAGVVLIMMRKCLIFLETNLVFSMLSGQATFLFLVENHLTARALAEANDQCSVLLSQVSRRKISKRCRYLSVAKIPSWSPTILSILKSFSINLHTSHVQPGLHHWLHLFIKVLFQILMEGRLFSNMKSCHSQRFPGHCWAMKRSEGFLPQTFRINVAKAQKPRLLRSGSLFFCFSWWGLD